MKFVGRFEGLNVGVRRSCFCRGGKYVESDRQVEGAGVLNFVAVNLLSLKKATASYNFVGMRIFCRLNK